MKKTTMRLLALFLAAIMAVAPVQTAYAQTGAATETADGGMEIIAVSDETQTEEGQKPTDDTVDGSEDQDETQSSDDNAEKDMGGGGKTIRYC